MNTSTLLPGNRTSLCYSLSKPPFENSSTIASLYFTAIFTPLGLLSNLVAFYVLVKSFQQSQSQTRSSFLILLGGLVVTDFMGLLTTGSIVLSFRIINFNWQVVDPNCHFCNFMGMSMVFYGLCPLLLGASMATERFIGINRPFTRLTSLPKNRTVSMLLFVWLVAGAVALLPVIGLGGYHIQDPGSWCFFHIDSKGKDRTFSLIFSLFGLLCITVSFLLNTVSVVTLIKMCCGRDRTRRRRDHEAEMMVQLILINVVASICWCPLLIYVLMNAVDAEQKRSETVLGFIRMASLNQILDPWIYIMCHAPQKRRVFIAKTVLSGGQLHKKSLLLWLRFATCNQILDPWMYILFRRAVIQRLFPCWSLGSLVNKYQSVSDTIRRFTLSSARGSQGGVHKVVIEEEQTG